MRCADATAAAAAQRPQDGKFQGITALCWPPHGELSSSAEPEQGPGHLKSKVHSAGSASSAQAIGLTCNLMQTHCRLSGFEASYNGDSFL
jgi:hypothetical protein